jgi:hypothetical protein
LDFQRERRRFPERRSTLVRGRRNFEAKRPVGAKKRLPAAVTMPESRSKNLDRSGGRAA